MTLQQKLLSEMVRRGLNGQKLARISQVSDSEISRILAGKSRPGLENAFRLARAVGVSLDFLADDTLDTDPARSTDPLSTEEREILELSHEIGCARAIRILDIVRYLGCDIAMHRLLDAKPIIEVGAEVRTGAPPVSSSAPIPATRATSA